MRELEITDTFRSFRECARHVWNAVLSPMYEDAWEPFESVERSLFEAIVLWDLPKDAKTVVEGCFLNLRVRVDNDDDGSCEILFSASGAGNTRHWQSAPNSISESLELRFMECFDWNDFGDRDFRYIRARLCEEGVALPSGGAELLIPASRASIQYIGD